MPEAVRVRDNITGHEYTTYAVDENGRVDDGLTVLTGEPAVDERTGNPLPAKPAPPKQSVAVAQPTAVTDVPVDDDPVTDPATTGNPKATAKKTAQASPSADAATGPKATPKEN